jgi:hypothetical protein
MMPFKTITVEPVAPPAGGSGEDMFRRDGATVQLLALPAQGGAEAPDLIEPIVGFRNWRVYRTGPASGELSSPFFPVPWRGRVVRAECRRWRTPEELLESSHTAPDAGCGCGIRAYHSPPDGFSKVDYQAVTGIVTVWGRIEIGAEEMRAERARVEALALYHRWSRRQTEAVRATAANLGVDLVDLRELSAAAAGYGAPPPAALLRSGGEG